MSESVTIKPGEKIRIAGIPFRATEATDIDVERLEPLKAQKNRHMALICVDTACQEEQRRVLGRLYKIRTTVGSTAKWHSPICGFCGNSFQFEQVTEPEQDTE